ncbi:MAG: hypothetical protein WD077_07330 [Bacteroidia bacterium]
MKHQPAHNQLGINAHFLVQTLISGDDARPSLEVIYKRRFERYAFRVSGSYGRVGQYLQGYYANLDSISTQRVRTVKEGNISLRSGIEFRQNFGSAQVYYGSDIYLGNHFGYLRRDSLDRNGIESATLEEVRANIISCGVQPFFGIEVPLSDNLSIAFEGGVKILYNTSRVTILNNHGVERRNSHFYDMDFDPFIERIVFSYHF